MPQSHASYGKLPDLRPCYSQFVRRTQPFKLGYANG